MLEVPLAAVLAGGPVAATLRAELTLPRCAGVPLTVTDACGLESGQILLSAVAEATADSLVCSGLSGCCNWLSQLKRKAGSV